jgi:hypothetical protein
VKAAKIQTFFKMDVYGYSFGFRWITQKIAVHHIIGQQKSITGDNLHLGIMFNVGRVLAYRVNLSATRKGD